MVSEISHIYVNGFNKIVADPNFTPNELVAISMGYTKLLEEGGALVMELKNVVTGTGSHSQIKRGWMPSTKYITEWLSTVI